MVSALKRSRDEHAFVLREMQSLVDLAERENRNLTEAESAKFKELETRLPRIQQTLKIESARQEMERNMKTVRDPNRPTRSEWHERHGHDVPYPHTGGDDLAPVWKDTRGHTVHVLSPSQKITEHCMPVARSQLHLGKAIRSIITGDWRDAEAERLAMSGSTNTAGGYLVPDVLSGEILDLARAKSVVMRAGARTIPMSSETLVLARVSADPVLAQKVENEAFSATAPAFDGVSFTTETWGALVTASRELAQDAPNFAELIQGILVKAMAVKLDALALVADTNHFGSIPSATNVSMVSVAGALSYEKLSEAIKDIEQYNYTPSVFVISPSNKSKLALLTTGDGTNASKNWLGASPDVAQLEQLVTTSMTDATAIVGDFSHCAYGVRVAAEVRVSEEAGTSFEKNQVWVRIIFRGAFRVLQPRAFAYLSGIS